MASELEAARDRIKQLEQQLLLEKTGVRNVAAAASCGINSNRPASPSGCGINNIIINTNTRPASPLQASNLSRK